MYSFEAADLCSFFFFTESETNHPPRVNQELCGSVGTVRTSSSSSSSPTSAETFLATMSFTLAFCSSQLAFSSSRSSLSCFDCGCRVLFVTHTHRHTQTHTRRNSIGEEGGGRTTYTKNKRWEKKKNYCERENWVPIRCVVWWDYYCSIACTYCSSVDYY